MKIGMLTSVSEKCGIAQYSRELCKGFGQSAEIEVVPVRAADVSWKHYINESSRLLNMRDVLHIQHEYSFWGSILPGKNMYFRHLKQIKPPKVITAHTLDTAVNMLNTSKAGGAAQIIKRIIAKIPSFIEEVEYDVFDKAELIIVHDNPSRDILLRRGILDKKLRVVPMGVPEPYGKHGLDDEFRRKNNLLGKKLIVIFGFIRPGRGYEQVIELLPDLDKRINLVIAGGIQTKEQKGYLAQLNEKIEDEQLGGRVTITGYLSNEEATGAIQSADLILCSQEAGTGSYSVQVALGHGKPILASDLPCFTDMEESYGCLMTYRNGNRADLFQKTRALLMDEEQAALLAQSAKDYAESHTWGKIAEKTLLIYKELYNPVS